MVDGECTRCDGSTCGTCGSSCVHVEGCPEGNEWDLPLHAAEAFPYACTKCGRAYETPRDFARDTTTPDRGKSISTLDGVADTWQRNCPLPCGQTMCIDIYEEV